VIHVGAFNSPVVEGNLSYPVTPPCAPSHRFRIEHRRADSGMKPLHLELGMRHPVPRLHRPPDTQAGEQFHSHRSSPHPGGTRFAEFPAIYLFRRASKNLHFLRNSPREYKNRAPSTFGFRGTDAASNPFSGVIFLHKHSSQPNPRTTLIALTWFFSLDFRN